MGTQVALFADTIIATFLPAGALSALYYADRLNQLPIGVIGIAIGTVLLPEMSRRLTSDDHAGAMASQRRAFDFTLLFSVPFVAAFLTVARRHHAGDVRARRVLEGRCRGRRRHAGRLCGRIDSVRADPQRGRDLLRPQGYRDAGEGGADRCCRQRRAENCAGGVAGAGRSRACDRGRRLDQSVAGDRVCGAGEAISNSTARWCSRWRNLSRPASCSAPLWLAARFAGSHLAQAHRMAATRLRFCG